MKFYYPSPFLREMSDIDILIHGDFMEQAAVELEAMGYVLQQKIKHHDIYRKAPGIVVEAHRAMYDRTVEMRGSMPISRICPGRCAERVFCMCMILRRKISIFT